MVPNLFFSELVLIVSAAILFYAAYNDLRQYKVRNELIAVLAALYFVHALVSGRWVNAQWNVVFALGMFIILLVFYSRGLMGGGDVKLLTVAFLWVGIGCAMPYAVLLLLFSGLHIIAAKFRWVGSQLVDGDTRKRIPFAPSIAGALIGIFMLGCLAPR